MKPIGMLAVVFTQIMFDFVYPTIAEEHDGACSMQSSQSKSIMAVLLQDYDKASNPSGSVIDVQAEVSLLDIISYTVFYFLS